MSSKSKIFFYASIVFAIVSNIYFYCRYDIKYFDLLTIVIPVSFLFIILINLNWKQRPVPLLISLINYFSLLMILYTIGLDIICGSNYVYVKMPHINGVCLSLNIFLLLIFIVLLVINFKRIIHFVRSFKIPKRNGGID